MENLLNIISSTLVFASVATSGIGAPALPDTNNADLAKFYVGGFTSVNSAEVTRYALPADSLIGVEDLSGSLVGGFFGHNYQNGVFVLGVEAAYSTGDMHSVSDPASRIETMIDLKLHTGYAFDQSMVYAIGGVAFAHHTLGAEYVDSNGISYGIGMQYMLAEHWFVSAEYLIRNMQGIANTGTERAGYLLSSAQMRLGYNF